MASSEYRDDEGNIINPPVIPEYEQRLNAATAQGNQDEINAIQEEYHQAREDRVSELEQRQQQNANGQQGENPDPNANPTPDPVNPDPANTGGNGGNG